MKGRPSKPAAARSLQGDTRKQKKPPAAPMPEPQGLASKDFFSPGSSDPADPWSPPAWLCDGARAVWCAELPVARQQTKLQEAGRPVFAAYCDAVWRLQHYSQVIARDGATYTTPSGYRRKSPEVELRDRAANEVRQLAGELNLTPKSWIGSMGTFAGRQLDLFLRGGAPSAEPAPRAAPAPASDDLSSFLGARPTLQ